MGQESFNKKEREKKKQKKKLEKQRKKENRKSESQEGEKDDMIVYVDAFGNFTDTPPDPDKKEKVDASSIDIGVPKQDKEDIETGERSGKVAFYNDAKGYGFIMDASTQEKYFFHINNCIDEVWENDKVTFELARGEKGLNAVNVKKK